MYSWYSFSAAGFGLGAGFLLLFAAASAFGLHLLSCCALHLGKPCSFRRVTALALPDTLGWIVDATGSWSAFPIAVALGPALCTVAMAWLMWLQRAAAVVPDAERVSAPRSSDVVQLTSTRPAQSGK